MNKFRYSLFVIRYSFCALHFAFCTLLGCAQKTSTTELPTSSQQLKPDVISALVPENQKYRDILAEELKGMIERKETFLLIDVRTSEEYATGYIERATNIPYTEIKNKSRTFG